MEYQDTWVNVETGSLLLTRMTRPGFNADLGKSSNTGYWNQSCCQHYQAHITTAQLRYIPIEQSTEFKKCTQKCH